MSVQILKELYCGFTIDQRVGNNAFSFDQREHKSIYVPSLIEGGLEYLKEGRMPVFAEYYQNKEYLLNGLDLFLYWKSAGKHIFIFDNHNHAFFFWLYGLNQKMFNLNQQLVHVDQHTDMRDPEVYPSFSLQQYSLKEAFTYTNYTLNVGNFIKPALKLGIFSDIEMVTKEDDLQKPFSSDVVLDIDIDFFSDEMGYISHQKKVDFTQNLIHQSSFITVATSPYFIEQRCAIEVVLELFSCL